MSFLRNKEIRLHIGIYTLLTAIFTAAGLVIGRKAGLLVFLACLAFILSSIIFTCKRYRRLASFAEDIDNVLEGQDAVCLEDYSEGELAILKEEVKKLTLQLRYQAHALSKDKAYLADSLADISHQLRTPLTSMNLLSALLSKPDLEDSRRMEYIQDMQKQLARIDWLISSLLKISRLDAGTVTFNRSKVNVRELIEKASSPLQIPMDLKNQQLAVSMDGSESFTGDLAWSAEALGNILKNCMEHTPYGGRISIECSENALFTEIKVSDTGEGIAEEDLPHLFERFYKGKNASNESIGIGLALARMIITSQNGTIKAENLKDGGSLFTIRFYKTIV